MSSRRTCDQALLDMLEDWELSDQAEKLAKHEVFSVEDAETMTTEDVQAWELPNEFNTLLSYLHTNVKFASDLTKPFQHIHQSPRLRLLLSRLQSLINT